MKQIKLICQIVAAFVIAFMAYSFFYQPNQDSARAKFNETFTSSTQAASAVPEGKLKITVLDVGQADAILLQDGKRNIMVDVGDSRKDKMGFGGQDVLEKSLAKNGVKNIDTVIVSHHHSDHMGNIKWVAEKYGVKNIYDNAMPNSRFPLSGWLNKELRAGKYNNKVLKQGDVINIDKGYYLEVLAPGNFLTKKELKELNNTSVVMKLHYGQFTMILTGDAEAPVEDALQKKYGNELKADILKVGHHGSKSSSIYKFISKVKPSYALISCGEYSIYHHPNAKVVSALKNLGAKVLTTKEHGSLTVLTDGKDFDVKTEK